LYSSIFRTSFARLTGYHDQSINLSLGFVNIHGIKIFKNSVTFAAFARLYNEERDNVIRKRFRFAEIVQEMISLREEHGLSYGVEINLNFVEDIGL